MTKSVFIKKICKHGEYFIPSNDIYVGKSMIEYGEWAEGENDLMSHYLNPGDVCIEVGSNIGCHTIPMSRMVGRTGKIICFEPQRLIFQTLCANIINNNILNTQVFNCPVLDCEKITTIPDYDLSVEYNYGGVRIGSNNGIQLISKTIDSLNLNSLKFIKIDAEECEPLVLLGSLKTIDKFLPSIMLEYHYHMQDDINQILGNYFIPMGYRVFLIIEKFFNPNNFNTNNINHYIDMCSINLFLSFDEPPKLNNLEITELFFIKK